MTISSSSRDTTGVPVPVIEAARTSIDSGSSSAALLQIMTNLAKANGECAYLGVWFDGEEALLKEWTDGELIHAPAKLHRRDRVHQETERRSALGLDDSRPLTAHRELRTLGRLLPTRTASDQKGYPKCEFSAHLCSHSAIGHARLPRSNDGARVRAHAKRALP